MRIGPITQIREILREFGVDPGPVLKKAGVAERLLENPDNRVDFDVIARLSQEGVAATNCTHFGLAFGQHFSPATMGLVFQLARNSASLGAGLHALALHLHVHDRGGVAYLLRTGPGEVGMAYGIYHRADHDVAPVYDAATAILFALLRALGGARWRPLRVTLPRRKPARIGPYRRYFGVPVVFDAEHASVVFAERWLDAPIPGADPTVRAAIERRIQAQDAARALTFSEKVRRALRSMILTGRASAEQVSLLFAMSRRTLHRQLSAEGTSLHLLANEIRFEVARQLLNESDMPAGEIAAVLRYADASAFSRAFRAWSGLSPREWRQSLRRASAGAARGT